MKRFERIALSSFLVLFISIQFYLTLFGGFFWPFSSHRLFSQMPLKKKPIVQAVLEDAEGNICIVHPGKIIPIEYARCSGLVRNLTKKGVNDQQAKLVNYLLARINENPWWAFDEMFSAVKPPKDKPFVKLKFETHVVEFEEGERSGSLKVHDRMAMFP